LDRNEAITIADIIPKAALMNANIKNKSLITISLSAFPDLRPGIPDPNISKGITFDLYFEPIGLPDEVGGVLGCVFDILDILVTVEGVGATVMHQLFVVSRRTGLVRYSILVG
jgi:hypothetical protein